MLRYLAAVLILLALQAPTLANDCKDGQCKRPLVAAGKKVAEKSIVVSRKVVSKAKCIRQKVKCRRKCLAKRLRRLVRR